MAQKITPARLTRPLGAIAQEIQQDYDRKGKPVYFAAVPYLAAMRSLDGLNSKYFEDSAEDIVIRLLGNLSTWRGETATRVKAELRAALADHKAVQADQRAERAAERRLFRAGRL